MADGRQLRGPRRRHLQRWNVPLLRLNAGTMAAGAVRKDGLFSTTANPGSSRFYEVNAIDGLYAIIARIYNSCAGQVIPATGQAVRLRAGQLRASSPRMSLAFCGNGDGNDDRWLRLSDYAAGNGINNLPFRMYSSGVEAIHFGAWNDVWLGTSSGTNASVGTGPCSRCSTAAVRSSRSTTQGRATLRA